MNFKILKTVQKTSAKGVGYAIASVINEHGVEYQNVTLFSPNSSKGVDESLVGELSPNDYKGKTGWKFQEERTNTLDKPSYNRSPSSINKAMDKKASNIAQAQENRAEGVKIASTFRDATLITTSRIKSEHTDEQIQAEWLKWRSWLFKNWDVDEPPF